MGSGLRRTRPRLVDSIGVRVGIGVNTIKCDECRMEGPPFPWMGGPHSCLRVGDWSLDNPGYGYAPALSFRLTEENIAWLMKTM